MKKNIFLILILITGFWGEVAAHDFWAVNSDGDTLYYNITSAVAPYTVEVTYKGTIYYQYDDEYIGDINIPSTVFYRNITYSVTAIGRDAFEGCDLVTTVHIPSSVTSFKRFAFSACRTLSSINIPESVETIEACVFAYCNLLPSIDIPNSVKNHWKRGILRLFGTGFGDCPQFGGGNRNADFLCMYQFKIC